MVQSLVGIFAADGILDLGHVVDASFFDNYIGGGMNSVIFQEVREARSLAYSAGGGYGFGGRQGDENMVYGALGCQADKTVEAAALLRGLVQSPPWSEPRFLDAAKAIEERYRGSPIPFRAIPGSLLEWEDQGIPGGDPRPQRFAKALRYKLEDLKAFVRHLQDQSMTIYVLGHRDRAGLDGLKKLGGFEEKTLGQIFPY
jgi:hypothetical protein